jgi:hypothetical protein
MTQNEAKELLGNQSITEDYRDRLEAALASEDDAALSALGEAGAGVSPCPDQSAGVSPASQSDAQD